MPKAGIDFKTLVVKISNTIKQGFLDEMFLETNYSEFSNNLIYSEIS